MDGCQGRCMYVASQYEMNVIIKGTKDVVFFFLISFFFKWVFICNSLVEVSSLMLCF